MPTRRSEAETSWEPPRIWARKMSSESYEDTMLGLGAIPPPRGDARPEKARPETDRRGRFPKDPRAGLKEGPAGFPPGGGGGSAGPPPPPPARGQPPQPTQ